MLSTTPPYQTNMTLWYSLFNHCCISVTCLCYHGITKQSCCKERIIVCFCVRVVRTRRQMVMISLAKQLLSSLHQSFQNAEYFFYCHYNNFFQRKIFHGQMDIFFSLKRMTYANNPSLFAYVFYTCDCVTCNKSMYANWKLFFVNSFSLREMKNHTQTFLFAGCVLENVCAWCRSLNKKYVLV